MSQKPNIIFMLTDDQRYDTMGFMGSKQVYTPNLDALAADGVRFNHAFHVAPICMPSRASIQLGKYICEHNCGFDLPTNYTISSEEYQQSYPVLLRKDGYFTGFIGKFGFPVSDTKRLKEERTLDPEAPKDDPYMLGSNRFDHTPASLPAHEFDVWKGFEKQGNYLKNPDGTFNGYEDKWNDDHLLDFTTHQVEEFLEDAKASGKPFALSLSYKAPHGPMIAQTRWQEYYDKIKIERMENDKIEYFLKLPKVVRTHSRNADEYWGSRTTKNQYSRNGLWKHDDAFQKEFSGYYGLISGVDESVGLVRKKLEELGLDKNTIIIYTSDNGYFCGSKQLAGKELLYEESIKAPMIVFDPRMESEKQDKWIEGMISHVDICPTILDYAGIEKPAHMQGQSFVPLVNGTEVEINDAVYGENDFNDHYAYITEVSNPEEYQSIHSKYVRTKEFKYIRYHLCHPIVEEMWEIDKDPLETENLVGNPAYEHKLNEMRKMMDDFIATTTVDPEK